MLKLDGLEVSRQIRGTLKENISDWASKNNRSPGLSVILVGEDPASQVYVSHKEKACGQVGINSEVIKMPANSSFEEVSAQITKLNNNAAVDGILVQLPLPKHLNERKVLELIDPKKDPDGLTIENIGLFYGDIHRVKSCTPNGVMEILKHYNIETEGKRAVVIGRSQIVGLPMFNLLQQANATVTLCHSRTKNLNDHTLNADIVVVAAGIPEFLGKENFKKGSIIIDVGIHRKLIEGKNKLVGDVRYSELEGWVEAATPVPKGVGPMTITMLLQNTFDLAKAE